MRRASSSLLASGCAFATTACHLPILFSAALNRPSDGMKANFGRLDAYVKTEMKDIRTATKDLRNEMKDFRNSIKSDIQKRVSMNERIIYVYCVGGFFVLVYVAELSFRREMKVARALERSQTTVRWLLAPCLATFLLRICGVQPARSALSQARSVFECCGWRLCPETLLL